ncbi:MAG: QueT transporter [Firmicutes bacterium ADurb.Bin506]|jgi:uncharacterized membrane protein|nr:MAG: QueT transporter [Firmicutes bacterium ADurb.Bin506]
MNPQVRYAARASATAGLYVVLCLALAPLSYGVVQVRVAEGLTLLPLVWPEAVPGLAVGALIANAIGPYGIVDIILGSAATALAAWLTWRTRRRRIAPLWPVIVNGLVVGAYVPFVAGLEIHAWTVPVSMVSVALGEAIAVFAVGFPLIRAMERLGLIQ